MKRSKLIIVMLIQSFAINAQTTISGNVQSATGEMLPGVNIYIKGTLDGGTSGLNGEFTFITHAVEDQVLVASMVGMKTFTISISITGKEVYQKITLRETISELNAVVITAGTFESGDVKKAAVLNAVDIATTAGATADIFGALQTLPGTMPSMEESGLFVRGGNASESKTFFDGILVNKVFTSYLPDISQRGRFSPFMFKGTSFNTGAYSAQHGGALSSTVMLESKDLAPKSKSELGIMSVGMSADHAERFKNSSLEIGTSYYNLNPVFEVVKQNTKWTHEPESWQGNAFYKMKTGENGLFKIYGMYEKSRTGLINTNHADITKNSSYNIASNNFYLNSTWSQFLGKRYKIYAGAGYGNDLDKINIDSNTVRLHNHSLHGRVMIKKYFGKLSDVKAGIEILRFNIAESFNWTSRSLESSLTAVFVESNIFIGNSIAIRPGMRFESSRFISKQNVAPRISFAYQLEKNSQVSVGYGLYYQMPADEYLFETFKPDFESAQHMILNYQYRKDKRTFRAETYYKAYDHLVKENPELNNKGTGYSRGIDIFYRDTKTIRYADYWITYSLLDTKRNYRNYPVSATPTFTAKHVVNIVAKYFINKWSTSIGATYTIASGRTYYNPNNPIFLNDKTRSYHNFSMNVSYLTQFCKRFTIVYLSVENVFGINNVYGYRYSPDGQTRKSIIPSAPRGIFLGIFITFGDVNPLSI